ncbi:ABC transporter permease [Ensifer sp. R-19]|uniref:ABC transporter permease n=1 Tax=Ensifer sp. R-19 TaxID=3404055 RepID=UPI003CE7754D
MTVLQAHEDHPAPVVRKKPAGIFLSTLRTPKGRIGAILLGSVVLLAILGPWLTSVDPEDLVGIPFDPPGPDALFGTDYLGHDTLSRFLHGGRAIMVLAAISALLGVGLGTALGLVAAYMKGTVGSIIMRALDVLLCFPALVLTLLVASMIGTSLPLVCIVVALSHVPRTARVIYASALQLSEREFVVYAEMIGASRFGVMLRELLPNLAGLVALELGLRATWSIGIVASLSFIGLGVQPPAADWGLMINENQPGLLLQPWPVLLPVAAICIATIGANLFTDAFSQKTAGVSRTITSGGE